ncbi:sodium/hydrogen exchanger [Dentipellis sp. KUC8613]|nr:sodium/hydrogen exchanger [Dentipellis sp. KUC8613]
MPIKVGSIPTAVVAAAAEATPTATPVPEEEEFYSSWSLFLVCLLLILSLWTSYYLQIKRIRAVHETLVSIFAGMFVGLVVRLAPGHLIREMLTFKHTLFFNLLLPPIILNSGYELKQENFFRNFGSILIFAFLGTFISAVGVGILVYIWSFLGLESLNVSLLECLIFGTTLSATDPVTILAIFNQYKVDPKLYTVIFGESLLNDAVSIVMYETLSQFHGTEIYLSSLFHGTGIFLLSFSVSMALGVAFGLSMSLVLKHSSLAQYPAIETCLVALSAYTCYFFSNGLSMSGIVSLLFCGITLKHYAYHTMSRRTQRATKYIFATLAQLSENFIFVYLGLSLFTSPPAAAHLTSYVKPLFIAITTVAVVFTRYAAVFPLSEAINFFHRHARGQRQDELPHSYQMMLFWAGLRGAVGVALAAGFQGENAQTLRTTVLVVVVLTVVVFGGTTARMLEVLGIRTGVEDEGGEDSEDDDVPPRWYARRGGNGGRWASEEDERGYFAAAQRVGMHYPNANARVGGSGGASTPRSYNHHHLYTPAGAPGGVDEPASPFQTDAVFSAASSESWDSDGGEVLPLAPAGPSRSTGGAGAGLESGGTGTGGSEESKWFQAIDERYLLPLFSNATASRTFHARRARRSAAGAAAGSGGMGEEAEEDDLGAGEMELGARAQGERMPSGEMGPRVNGESVRSARGLPSPSLRRESPSETQ